jgi:hypothetical protein
MATHGESLLSDVRQWQENWANSLVETAETGEFVMAEASILYWKNMVENSELLRTAKFGPNYNVEIKTGEKLQISSARQNMQWGDLVLFISYDKASNPVGFVSYKITPNDLGVLSAVGTIVNFQRGFGNATGLELAVEDYLTRLSSERKKTVIIKAINRNQEKQRTMQLARQVFGTNPVPDGIQKLADDAFKEQVAWQALYGPNGKLGFNDKGEKVINPVVGVEMPTEFTTIDLARQEILGPRNLVVPKVVSHRPIANLQALPTKLQQAVRRIVGNLQAK